MTQGSITQCTLYGKKSLQKNVIISMFKERIGLGLDYYKVMTYMLLPFINQFYYLLRMIPPEKILLYPKRAAPLICNHLTFPNKILTIHRISTRIIPDKDCPGYCKLCKTFWYKNIPLHTSNTTPEWMVGFRKLLILDFNYYTFVTSLY